MNHKRKRPKSSRAGCLLCKPHKRQGSCLHNRDPYAAYRQIVVTKEKVAEALSAAARHTGAFGK